MTNYSKIRKALEARYAGAQEAERRAWYELEALKRVRIGIGETLDDLTRIEQAEKDNHDGNVS